MEYDQIIGCFATCDRDDHDGATQLSAQDDSWTAAAILHGQTVADGLGEEEKKHNVHRPRMTADGVYRGHVATGEDDDSWELLAVVSQHLPSCDLHHIPSSHADDDSVLHCQVPIASEEWRESIAVARVGYAFAEKGSIEVNHPIDCSLRSPLLWHEPLVLPPFHHNSTDFPIPL